MPWKIEVQPVRNTKPLLKQLSVSFLVSKMEPPYDLRFKCPANFLLAGPTQSGKEGGSFVDIKYTENYMMQVKPVGYSSFFFINLSPNKFDI